MAKNKIDGGFIVIPKNTLRCVQWKELTPATRIVYITMLTEYIRDKKLNPESIVKITQRQIERSSGLSHPTIVRAMRKLVEQGFVEIIEKGGLERNYSVYRLPYRFLY